MERLVLPLPPDYPPLAAFWALREEMKGGFGPAIVKKHSIFRLDGSARAQVGAVVCPTAQVELMWFICQAATKRKLLWFR